MGSRISHLLATFVGAFLALRLIVWLPGTTSGPWRLDAVQQAWLIAQYACVAGIAVATCAIPARPAVRFGGAVTIVGAALAVVGVPVAGDLALIAVSLSVGLLAATLVNDLVWAAVGLVGLAAVDSVQVFSSAGTTNHIVSGGHSRTVDALSLALVVPGIHGGAAVAGVGFADLVVLGTAVACADRFRLPVATTGIALAAALVATFEVADLFSVTSLPLLPVLAVVLLAVHARRLRAAFLVARGLATTSETTVQGAGVGAADALPSTDRRRQA